MFVVYSEGKGILIIYMYIYTYIHVYIYMCMKKRDIYWRRYKIRETLCIGQWPPSPLQSRHVGTSHSSPSVSSTLQNTLKNPLLESPSAAPSYFPEPHWQSEISSLSKVILVLGKARSRRMPNLGCRGCPVTWVIWCLTKKLCMRRGAEWRIVVMKLSITRYPQLWPFFSYCISQLPNQTTQLTWSWSHCKFTMTFSSMENQVTSIGMTGPLFPDHSCRPRIHLWLWCSWGNLVHWEWFESSH